MTRLIEPSDIVAFASGFVGLDVRCDDDGDLLAGMGIEGEEASAFFASYAEHFSVESEKMLWFFHYKTNGSPFWRRIRPVDRDGRTFALIPVSPRLLADAANLGRWPLEYPTHKVHVSRWPIVLMFIFLATLVLSMEIISLSR